LTGGYGFVPEVQEAGEPRPSIGGLAKDTPFQRQNLIGTQDDRIGVLVLTLARLEFGQGIHDVTRAVAPSSSIEARIAISSIRRAPDRRTRRRIEAFSTAFRSWRRGQVGAKHH
jgi:hypothetical protein